jgi:thiamine pyrophosphokinase
MAARRAWIFVNGDLLNPEAVRAMIEPDDLLVAADGGLRHLQLLGLDPVVLIGDLDSVSEQDIQILDQKGILVEKHPVEKDETDLELALLWVLARDIREIRIAAAQGNRLDHTLGNLFLLMLPDLQGYDVRLEDGQDEVFLITSSRRIIGQAGDRVSLLPLGRPAAGVSTQGLQYELDKETLWPERTRGISNVMVEAQAVVSVENGLLICIHSRLPVEPHLPS